MIRPVEDLGAPAVVFLADWGTDAADKKSAADAFKWNRPVGIGLAAIGYILGGWLGYGGTFVKNLGLASFDWAAQSIKGYIEEAGTVTAASRVAVHPAARVVAGRVSSYPAQPKNREYNWPMAV